MARLTSQNGINVSGWAFIVGAEEDDIARFEKEEWEAMRRDAVGRMQRALDFYVTEVRRTLGRVLLVQAARFSWLTGRMRSSAPGEPPAKITGELMRSWVRGMIRWSRDRTILTGRIQSEHPAAGRLEFGDDPHGTKGLGEGGVQPHPYIRPTLARIADRLHDLVLGL